MNFLRGCIVFFWIVWRVFSWLFGVVFLGAFRTLGRLGWIASVFRGIFVILGAAVAFWVLLDGSVCGF